MADVEHVYLLLFLQNAKYHQVDVRLVPIQQVPQLFLLGRRGASVWMVLQTENGLFETPVPFQRCIGMCGVDFSVQVGKVALSAEVILTRYAMLGFEIVEKLPRRPDLSFFRVLQPLTDAFLHIGVGGNVEQALVGFGILHDSRCLSLHRKHHRALVLFKLFHEVAGPPPEGRQRLDVIRDVNHACFN